MIVDKNSFIPAYRQLMDYIHLKIRQKEWVSEIPSERQLSEMAGVTRMTVRQAVGELCGEGVLYRVKGKGTFIAKPKFEQQNIMSFSELLRARGAEPRTKLLWFDPFFKDMAAISPEWAAQHPLFYRLRRLRCDGDDPVGIEEVFLPCALYPDFEKHNLTGSLYEILHTYGQTVFEQDTQLAARRPTEEEAAVFGIRSDTPILSVSGSSLSENRTPLFYERSAYLSDRFSYKVSILSRS